MLSLFGVLNGPFPTTNKSPEKCMNIPAGGMALQTNRKTNRIKRNVYRHIQTYRSAVEIVKCC